MNPDAFSDFAERFADRVRRDLFPKLQASTIVVSIVGKDCDVKFALELGASILFDKPIIAVIEPGAEIPAKLALVVDRFVERRENMEEMYKAIRAAMAELGIGV